MKKLAILVGRSVILTAGCVLVAVLFNALRPEGIDLVAQSEYEIYVPCPESMAKVDTVTAEKAQDNVLYVDARPVEDFEREHIKGAISFPYPILGDPPQEEVDQLKRRDVPIVTYGDGGRGRLGEVMAQLLTEKGIPNVTHLKGGLKAWRDQGRELEGNTGEEASDE